MSNRDRVLAFLQSIAPAEATNSDIVARTGVRPHQQVFMITKELTRQGLIRGRQGDKEWTFWSTAAPRDAAPSPEPMQPPARTGASDLAAITPSEFEARALRAMSAHYQVPLAPGRVANVPKIFDLVSADERIVGDAKFLTLVRGERMPPAKFSVIAEHVWLLERTAAEHKFLVFGNDRRVPELWLKRYGRLIDGTEFFYLAADGLLSSLPPVG
jgi:hypothetical protein